MDKLQCALSSSADIIDHITKSLHKYETGDSRTKGSSCITTRQGNPLKSRESSEKEIDVTDRTCTDDLEWKQKEAIGDKIKLAEIALQNGNVTEAECNLASALVLCGNFVTLSFDASRVYDMLATLAYSQGELERARRLLVEVIKRLVVLAGSQSNRLVYFCLKLAKVYIALGMPDTAENVFSCIAAQRKKYDSGQRGEVMLLQWINALFWYGKFLIRMERYTDARDCFEKAYYMCDHIASIESEQVMVILYHLSETLVATGDTESALYNLMNAVIVGSRDKTNPDLPTLYVKMGMLYMHKSFWQEAKTKFYGIDHWMSTQKLKNLSKCVI